MKAILYAVSLIAFLALVTAPRESFAQANDTLVVSAFPIGNLNTVINADTNEAGQQQHIYLLQQTGSLDTTYFLTAPIVAKSNLTIIGERNPTTGNMPVIEPNINPDGSVTNYYVQAASGKVTLKGLYFLATRIDSATSTQYAFSESGDSTTLIADHDVFDDFNNANILDFHGSYCNIFVSNSEFRNIQAPFWQGGSIFWAEGGFPMDTVSFVDNTFFCVNRALYGSPGYIGYLDFNHNTVFCGVGGLLLATQLTNASITNNIFYSVIAHGADSSYIKNGGANGAHQRFGIIMVDTLKGFTHPPSSGYSITEGQRKVTVSNNAYSWSKALYSYWAAVTDTGAAHHSGLITPPEWMNAQTALEFTDKTVWPGFTESNNDSTDPGFATSLTAPAVDSMINFVNLIWTGGHIPSYRWYQNFADPNISDPVNVFNWAPKDWWQTQGYPVPEKLTYSNSALLTASTSGGPVGDLNWYPNYLPLAVNIPPRTMPTDYTLSQNYPNPFNPTTQIAYSVPRNGLVTLKVYNVLGQEVATLFSGMRQPGHYVATFNGSRFASGVYFYRLQAGSVTITKKLVMIK